MASIFGHSLVGYVLAKVQNKQSRLLIVLAILSTILPDFDVIGFYFGVSYNDPLGHRGFTHSIVFAVLWTLILVWFFQKKYRIRYGIVIFLATLSHSILDALTNGGKGVGFFIPFDNTRYFFGYRPIEVSPIGIKRFFSMWGLEVILSELLWVGLPCLIILLFNKFRK